MASASPSGGCGRRVALVLDVGNSLSSKATQIAAELSSSVFEGDILVTSENNFEGLDAVKHVLHVTNKQREHVHFHNLDPLDKGSIVMLKDFLMEHYGGLDILINSLQLEQRANVHAEPPSQRDTVAQAERLYCGTRHVSTALLPILKTGARVVHFADAAVIFDPMWARAREQMQLTNDPNQLDVLFKQVLDKDVKDDVPWPSPPLMTTQLFLAALVSLQQQKLDEDNTRDRVVNMVQTPLASTTSSTPTRSRSRAVHAALLPLNTDLRGRFVIAQGLESQSLDAQRDARLLTQPL